MQRNVQFIVVIGASAGGLKALSELVTQLNPDLPVAYFIVLHLSTTSIGDFLQYRLQQHTTLKCSMAADGMLIEGGHIYLSPAGVHLIVKENRVGVVHGPRENRWRPSIDVLFRSAAVAYAERCIGIILSGLLDDGTAGMNAIKRCGGSCIVQDPNQAEYAEMPLAVLDSMEVDFCLPLSEIGSAINEIVDTKEIEDIPIPEDIILESKIAEKTATGMDVIKPLGEQTVFTCPDCGGALREIKDGGNNRFRCFIGHAYTEADMLKKQTEEIESTLWVALRMMEERTNFLKKIATEDQRKGFHTLANTHLERADELKVHVDNLKKILFGVQKD